MRSRRAWAATIGILMLLVAPASAQETGAPPESGCYTIIQRESSGAGTFLLNRCTGDTHMLVPVYGRAKGGKNARAIGHRWARVAFQDAAAPDQRRTTGQGKSTLPAPSAKGHSFDGVWLGTFTAVEGCALQSGTAAFHIRESTFQHNQASVTPQGEVAFIAPARMNPDIKVSHKFKLAGNAGTGSYEAIGRPCKGKWVLKRVADPSTLSQSSQ